MYEDAVKNGARWMDHTQPGWFENVSLNNLNLKNYAQCSLGQTLGAVVSRNLCHDFQFAFANGFSLPAKKVKRFFGSKLVRPSDVEWRQLSAAWTLEIIRRRTAKRIEAEVLNKSKESQNG